MDKNKLIVAAAEYAFKQKQSNEMYSPRGMFSDGAKWAVDNYPINWINPEVELPPVEKDNESADVLVFYEYIGIKGGTYTDYGTGWCDMSPVPAEWHIASGPIDKFKVIGWAALNTPDWYNKATK